MAEKLTAEVVDKVLQELAGWQRKERPDSLCKMFRFSDFSAAFGWMTRAAMIAEQINHHPDWTNVYNRVEVRLTTHDAGGLTRKDLELAAHLDRLAADMGKG